MIREDVSRQLKVLIPEGKWKEKFNELDEAGKLDMRQMWQIVLILLQHVEKLEHENPQHPQPHTH